jgi:hypothetical protein
MRRIVQTSITALAALALASCGGGSKDGSDTDTEVTGDTAGDTDAVLDTSTDEGEPEPPDDVLEEDALEEEAVTPEPDLLFVYTVSGDYTAGSYSVVSLDDLTVHADLDSMHTDGKALCFAGQVFLNELFGADTVDPVGVASPWAVLDRHDVGDGSNPVDAIPRDATHLLVVQYGGAGLVELDLASGALTSTAVDLSSFDPHDSSPQAHAVAHVGSRYFVSIQRLDGWTATDPGLVVVLDDASLEPVDVDTTTPSTVDGIELPGMNPIGRFRALGTDLFVALTGTWGATDGGIARVDTAALSASWVVEGSDIGGDPVFGDTWEIVDATTGFVGYGLADGSLDAVRGFDPSAGTVSTTPVLTTSAGSLSGSALAPDGRMFVGDRHPEAPGLRIIDTGTGVETTTTPLGVGTQPPYALCAFEP